jgi:hypothetical protein
MGKIKKTRERDVAPTKSKKGKLDVKGKITKKEKQSAKRLTLFQQLENLKKIRDQEKASLIKKPFSLKELSDMLPLITEEYEKRKKNENTNVLPKAVISFTQVCDHPQFKESPLATIREHLSNNFQNNKNSCLQIKVEKSFRRNLEMKEMNVEEKKGKGKQGGERGSPGGGFGGRGGIAGRGGGNKSFNNKPHGGRK